MTVHIDAEPGYHTCPVDGCGPNRGRRERPRVEQPGRRQVMGYERDSRMTAAAKAMREDHAASHPRHEMWCELATLLDRLAELAPFWQEPYAAPFVPIIEAGVHASTAYLEASRV